MTGTIKAILTGGRFGFITAEHQDFFWHLDDLEDGSMFDQLSVGDVVQFQAVFPQPAKGPRARNVRYPVPEGGDLDARDELSRQGAHQAGDTAGAAPADR